MTETDATETDAATTDAQRELTRLAESVSHAARESGIGVAVAESLTGGQLASVLAAAESSSEWFRGGVVAYASEVKHDLLDVPPGPVVSKESARAMAARAGQLLGAELTVSVTGVGGPDEQDGRPPGTVWFAVAHESSDVHAELHHFDGGPEDVVQQATQRALRLLLEHAQDL